MVKLDLGLRIVQMLAELGIKPGTFLGKAILYYFPTSDT